MTLAPDEIYVKGSGGGGGKGGGRSGGAEEADNTLRSRAKGQIVDLISEGEIVGLVNGMKSIYFDETPVQNVSDSYNYEGVFAEERYGLPDQTHLTGSNAVETTNSVETEVKKELPVIRTITEQNADAVRVVIRLPSLVYQDTESGNLDPASVAYAIDVRPYNGTWSEVVARNIENQKTTSVYQRKELIELPTGGHPWDIRVRRLSDDSDSVYLQNETWWESYVVLVRGKYIYPNSALVHTKVDAELMGESIPERAYHVKGLIIDVPSNYDPINRTYNGVWDGTFRRAWSNNPAWILRYLLLHKRFGLGDFVDEAKIDKWGLYQIAQYCDEEVPTGYKDGGGNDVMEPRFVFNGVLNSREEAHRVIQNLVSTFRGMAFWSYGQVFAMADMPADPVKLVSPANVIDGKFEYSGTAEKARHSVALVSWNDPQDFYRSAVEVVIDDEALSRYGWRETQVQGHGITSRGQAHRFGKWMLDTEQNETETVTYEASWDHANVRPGDIIAVADPNKAALRTGGRIQSYNAATRQVVLDSTFAPTGGITYHASIELEDGSVDSQQIGAFHDEDGVTKITLVAPLTGTPVVGAMWIIRGADVNPRQYRVVSVKETDQHLFQITALFHDPNKYARVEWGIELDDISYTRIKNVNGQPQNVRATESTYYQEGVPRTKITVSWTPANDWAELGYDVVVQGPDGTTTLPRTKNVVVDIMDARRGDYTFKVYSVNKAGLLSPAGVTNFTALGWGGASEAYVTDLELEDSINGNIFEGSSPSITWKNVFPVSNASYAQPETDEQNNPFYKQNIIQVLDTSSGDLLRTEYVKGNRYTYSIIANRLDNQAYGRHASRDLRFEVAVEDVEGRISAPAVLLAENVAPPKLTPEVWSIDDGIHVQWETPQDLDFAGVLVWVSETPGFDPAVTEPTWRGTGGYYYFQALLDKAYYIRIAAFDTFSDKDLNYSDEFEIRTGARIVDLEPPEIPTGLTLSSSTSVGEDGSVVATLTASWNASAAPDFTYFQVGIAEGVGNTNFVSFNTGETRHTWTVKTGETYTVRVRAYDASFNASGYSETQSIVIGGDTQPPAKVLGVTAKGVFGAVWLNFDASPDSDISFYEVYASETTTAPAASVSDVMTTASTAFIHSDLTNDTQLNYWVRGVDRSGNRGEWSDMVQATPIKIDGEDIKETVIGDEHIKTGTLQALNAVINEAWINSANIVDLDAAKIRANTILASTVRIGSGSGATLGGLENDVQNPAAKINAASTLIEPGKIRLSGGTTLTNWLYGGNSTEINGGAIAANTIKANSLSIGARGLNIESLEFQYNPSNHYIYWTQSRINYTADNGNFASIVVSSGAVYGSTANTTYIYWVKGAGSLSTTTNAATAMTANNVLIATYNGNGAMLNLVYGGTQIDGSKIRTGSIQANQIAANAIQADKIGANSVTTEKLIAGAVSHIAYGWRYSAGSLGSGGVGNMAAVTINSNAYTRSIIVSGAFEAYATLGNQTRGDLLITQDSWVERNGSIVVYAPVSNANNVVSTIQNQSTIWTYNYRGSCGFTFIDTAPSTGTNSYVLKVRNNGYGATTTYRFAIMTATNLLR